LTILVIYESLRKYDINGDYRFVIIDRVVNRDFNFLKMDKLVMDVYDVLKVIGVSEPTD